jgi:hypothetical protein
MPQNVWNSSIEHQKLSEHIINRIKFPFKNKFLHGDSTYKNIWNINKNENNNYNRKMQIQYIFEKVIKKINM